MVTAYLSCSTNDHSSLPRRSPVPTLNRERPLQHFVARYYVSTIHNTIIFYKSYPRLVSPSVAIVQSLLGVALVFSYSPV